jgi:hypothetical protein
MIESMFSLLRLANRQLLYRIWRKAAQGEVDTLNAEERLLADIMHEHAEEYFNQFEFADVIGELESDAENENGPFTHIALHAAVENQLKNRDPVEAFQFYNAMRRKKCSHHDAIHLLGAILLHYLAPVLNQKKGRFELDGYLRLLKKYKSRRPEKIMPALENEPTSFIAEEPGSAATQTLNDIRSAMEGRNFGSLEEAQTFAAAFMEEKNRNPTPEFLGLSPEQMYRMLHRPLEDTDDIVVLNPEILPENLIEAPVVVETMYFLKRLNELQPLKATAKGNLPQAFAREMHTTFSDYPYPSDFKIMSEEDDPKLMALRRILGMCGLIKKQHNKFSLTRKGQHIVEKGFEAQHFLLLLKNYMLKFNWAFRDRYPEIGIVQQSVIFSCYLLYREAGQFIHTDELGDFLIRAYPMVLNTLQDRHPIESPEQTVRNVFALRFIERFCEYFGLVKIRRKPKTPYRQDRFVKTTSLFKKLFFWKL